MASVGQGARVPGVTPEERIQGWFPNLVVSPFRITSPIAPRYNCIAWAAGDFTRWWWPLGGYWPPSAPREQTVDAFVSAYASVGFTVCADEAYEADFEKVAIYVDEGDLPSHAAKQQPDGSWSSKLGRWEDVEHQLEGLEGATPLLRGQAYGRAAVFLKRPRSSLTGAATGSSHGS